MREGTVEARAEELEIPGLVGEDSGAGSAGVATPAPGTLRSTQVLSPSLSLDQVSWRDSDQSTWVGGAMVPKASWLGRLSEGEARAALTFAGQGVVCLPTLTACYEGSGLVQSWVRAASEALTGWIRQREFRWSGWVEEGFDLVSWIERPETAPDESYLASSVISQPLIFITQIAKYQHLFERGLSGAMGAVSVLTGHSQGMMPALLVAESPAGVIVKERFLAYVQYMLWQGYHMARSYLGQSSRGEGDSSPMAAVSGVELPVLEQALARLNGALPQERQVVISLYNTRTRHVLSGPVESLELLRGALEARASKEQERKRAGQFGGTPLRLSWEYLSVAAAYHSPYMAKGLEGMRAQVADMGFALDASQLRFDVLSPSNGDRYNDCEDLTGRILEDQFVDCVRWGLTVQRACGYSEVAVVLDLGPGDGVFRLTRSLLKGAGVDALALDTPEGERGLWVQAGPEPLSYADFAPRLCERGGQLAVENLYTRATGHSPVILPGMTPTTADVPIVAAAANAGYTAELAGGGQVTEAIFWRRMDELKEALEPGREVVFNALFLDPYLWGLHLGRHGLVQKARKAGYPLCGVTISAGLPEVQEAARLLDELVDAGLWLNAFKPGTLAQVKQVVKIAQAAPHHRIFVHLEGGKAGGHHSWEDLDQLLLDSYFLIRQQPNLVLCVGGGIGDEPRGVELLSGAWSQRYDQPAMPVDAIFLGTLAMACKEATASPQVKAALVEAAGDPAWVFDGVSKGGITSGKSALNADIHYIDNAAARCGRLLDQVAGDPQAVAARRHEIIDALNATAKPYFGALDLMTYLEVFDRMVELMAVGRHGAYEDGIWPDISFRARVADWIKRSEARLNPQDEGSFESILQDLVQLDAPQTLRAHWLAAYPQAETELLHPADVEFFLASICARPGKPVNFIPVIDEHVRRWYKADSLWQAQDPRYDAEQVLIIPGPEAIRGLKAVDEPVAGLLGRFTLALRDELRSAPSLGRVATPSLPQGVELSHHAGVVCLKVEEQAQEWFSWVKQAYLGQVPALFGAHTLTLCDPQGQKAVANPLRKICLPREGAELSLDPIAGSLSYRWAEEEVRVAPSQRPGALRLEIGRGLSKLDAHGPVSFALELEVHEDLYGYRFTCEADAYRDAIREFYQRTMFGELLEAAPLFESVHKKVVVSEVQNDAYKTITGGQPGAPDIAQNFVFSLAWGPLFRLLSCDAVAPGLFQLVHQENEVQCLEGWPIASGEEIEVDARIVRVEDRDAGRQVVTLSTLRRDGVPCAALTSAFFVRGAYGHTEVALESHRAIEATVYLEDRAAIAYLRDHDWIRWDEGAKLEPGMELSFEASTWEQRRRGGDASFRAQGSILWGDVEVAALQLDVESGAALHPLQVLLDTLGVQGPERLSRSPRSLARERIMAPKDLRSFAEISGDLNPIHQDHLFARMGGLPSPIVHGMWLSARMEHFLAAEVGGSHRLQGLKTEFLAPVLPGAELVFEARRIAICEGRWQVEVTAWQRQHQQLLPAARSVAWVLPPKTAFVFPGQGIQKQGMGMEGYTRSKAARQIWDRADAFTREKLGFSILHIVRQNPRRLPVRGQLHVHPLGVLHLTQFTQVAMAVLAQAQVAELREAGAMFDGAITCGHSLGEYNALGAVAQVLPLECVVDVVYRRGQAMHQLVARDEDGESGYRMMVIRPHYAGLDHGAAEALVEKIREQTGLFLQIVNYNVRGRQYAVTGKIDALKALQQALATLAPHQTKPACIEVPGIDVPFHSTELRDGVPQFRETLQRELPQVMDFRPLMGAYIPNLVPRPFSLQRDFIEEIAETAGSQVLQEVLEGFEEWQARPHELARVVLIELLAWQFASPVRWIETQELLCTPAHLEGLGVERIVEIGVGYQPTLANMARYSLRLLGPSAPSIQVMNAEADYDALCALEQGPELPALESLFSALKVEEASEEPVISEAPAAAAPVAMETPAAPAPAPGSEASEVAEQPVSAAEALHCIIALQARIRTEQIGSDETIDEIFDGVSSRRNQLLLDLGAEFNMGPIDGAHEKPMASLVGDITKAAGRYQAPGKYLRAAQDEAIRKVMGRSGMGRKDIESYLESSYGLPEGWRSAFFNAFALEAREGESARGGALGCAATVVSDKASAQGLLDSVVQRLSAMRGVGLAKRAATQAGSGAVVDSEALQALEDRIFGAQGVLMKNARDLAEHLGHALEESQHEASQSEALAQQLALYEAEHGREYAALIAPRFDARKHAAMTSVWSSARRDVATLYFDVLNRRKSLDEVADEADRLARFAGSQTVSQTASWYAAQARQSDAVDLAQMLEDVASGSRPGRAPFAPTRPQLEIVGGAMEYREIPDPRDASDALLDGVWSHAEAPLCTFGHEAWDEAYKALLQTEEAFDFAGKTALVTGASPGSIAIACVRHLLRGGARVVVTTSTYNPQRLEYYRALYASEACPGAELHVVPFNQASYQDTEALVDWIFGEVSEQAGGEIRILKQPWSLDLLLPFAAIKDLATLDGLGDRSNAVIRGMLVGVERLIGAVATKHRQSPIPGRRCHILLPLSPNHGAFGGDGLYAETKAAMEVLLDKWHSESQAWGRYTSLCGARIGWVRGTGLMDANNPVAARLEQETGVRTFSSHEMGYLLAALLTEDAVQPCLGAPLTVDLTGGFAAIEDLKSVVDGIREELELRISESRRAEALRSKERQLLGLEQAPAVEVRALPAWPARHQRCTWRRSAPTPQVGLERCVVIVGAAEIGPLGSSRTRFEMEVEGSLSAAGVLELAWITGLVKYEVSGRGGSWVDVESGEEVAEEDIASRYRQEVESRVGIRWVEPETLGFDPGALPVMASVYLERDFSFPASTREEAMAFYSADPEHTAISHDEEAGHWKVTRKAGAQVQVPRKARLKRQVAGMIPTDFDFGRYGITPDMVERIDRVTLFNLVATVDAFLSSGLSPEQLLQWIHPARVANTQGSGIGGMKSLHRLYLDHFIGEERQQDILQETLINVVAAHVVQGFVGSYGPMSHPVAACATAAVSVEEGFDKILAGKADFVVAGGFDDIGREGMVGFGDMHATADTDEMQAMGFVPSQMSRPNDVRRRGFVEAHGGGTLLMTRGDVALKYGLPVLGVVGYAGSFGDGIHKSIPAPGMGALASAMGGMDSPLGLALRQYGLGADDIAVVSKHDTSTTANDKNENALHHRIQEALGRTPGNPLFAISQKSLTGHSKGGAAAWQSIALLQVLQSGAIPGNRNLESVDEAMKPYTHLCFSDRPLRVGEAQPLRAALLTSLGFGHVSGILLLLHPESFLALLSEQQRRQYLLASELRQAKASRDWAAVMLEQKSAFDKRTNRRFYAADGTQAQADEEAAMLLDPRARLDLETGVYKLHA